MIRQITAVDIIPYAPEFQPVFKSLNLEWLEAYGLTDDHDLLILDDPENIIIKPGGVIYLAAFEGKIIGTSALMKKSSEIYELAKMAVAENMRGKGIGKQLIEKCLDHARTSGAKKVMLYSNHQLKSAIALYEQYGFRHVPVSGSPFESADVQMESIL